MPSSQGLGPVIPRRRFGTELRRLRRERDKNLSEVAHDLLISTSKLSRLEKGHSAAQERDVRDLLRYYGQVDTELGKRMRQWAKEGREEPWWQQTSSGVPPITEHYMQYEIAASKINGFVIHFVPTLLQTADYARALLTALHPTRTAAEIDTLVSVVLQRQEVLTREQYPASLDMIIDEAALRRQADSQAIMLDQLEQLVSAGNEPNVTLRVLPFSAGPHQAHAEGSFTYFTFRRDIDSDIVNIEGYVTDSYVEGDQVQPYWTLLEELRARALDPASTLRFIDNIAQELRREV
ncbi:DUF5753 domain-containing protein [Pseudonocardia acaciae]|uniref:DUF5753 domain-containing protein n=1 Tax=Pseudonocardia acaciae TaxID=551276 RepID=UPI00048AB195|nr:DUF5753 domain-containing protein [Pseudonocardia acaciae]